MNVNEQVCVRMCVFMSAIDFLFLRLFISVCLSLCIYFCIVIVNYSRYFVGPMILALSLCYLFNHCKYKRANLIYLFNF